MKLDTPEGVLTIDDDALTYTPADSGDEVNVPLSPLPEYRYERGLYGFGTLVVADHVFVLRNDQAPTVVEELRRPRTASKPRKSAAEATKPVLKADSDAVSTADAPK